MLAVDLPGHDRSPGPSRGSLAAYADDLLGFLDALGLERAFVAGHSMGGGVALELAVAHPERVAGLALISTGARLRVAPTLLAGLATDPDAAIDQMVAMMYPEPAAQWRAGAADEYRRCADVLRADLVACDGWDIRGRLAGLALPAVVVAGNKDVMTPPKLAHELQALLGAELVMLPGVGHVPMVEACVATSEALRGVWRLDIGNREQAPEE